MIYTNKTTLNFAEHISKVLSIYILTYVYITKGEKTKAKDQQDLSRSLQLSSSHRNFLSSSSTCRCTAVPGSRRKLSFTPIDINPHKPTRDRQRRASQNQKLIIKQHENEATSIEHQVIRRGSSRRSAAGAGGGGGGAGRRRCRGRRGAARSCWRCRGGPGR